MKTMCCSCLRNVVFFKAKDRDDEETRLVNELFDEKIPHEYVVNGVFKTCKQGFAELQSKGFKLEEVEVKDIGDLPLEERNTIKQFNREQQETWRWEARQKLREKPEDAS